MGKLIKEIANGRLLKNNGSWMYCDKCDKTVGYLCYTTYASFQLDFDCKCGNKGRFHLEYNTELVPKQSSRDLTTNKNRLCCPNDEAPLFTIVEKNLEKAHYTVTCKKCLTEYNNG